MVCTKQGRGLERGAGRRMRVRTAHGPMRMEMSQSATKDCRPPPPVSSTSCAPLVVYATGATAACEAPYAVLP